MNIASKKATIMNIVSKKATILESILSHNIFYSFISRMI
jgi:hypothetical protein